MSYTTVERATEYARNLEVSYGKASVMSPTQLETYIADADTIIDAHLSHAYFTPLNVIIRGGVTKYPDPIPFIATKIAAAMAVRSVYSRIDAQLSQSAEAHLADALRELSRFSDGQFQGNNRLDGQRLKARNFFINPSVAPLDPPTPKMG